MTYTISEQMLSLLYAFCIGLVLGCVYDVLRILRLIFRKVRHFLFASDILFMLIFTFTTVVFSMGFTKGSPRYFIIIGEFCGILAYRFTLGLLSLKIFGIIFAKTKKFFKIVTDFTLKNTKKLLQLSHNILYNKHRKKDKVLDSSPNL